jgi:hypothetical protein
MALRLAIVGIERIARTFTSNDSIATPGLFLIGSGSAGGVAGSGTAAAGRVNQTSQGFFGQVCCPARGALYTLFRSPGCASQNVAAGP